ncbi:replication factor C small subunit [Chlorella virus XW01]|nr:replication factor C small subunit [Chlorella virus XW01]
MYIIINMLFVDKYNDKLVISHENIVNNIYKSISNKKQIYDILTQKPTIKNKQSLNLSLKLNQLKIYNSNPFPNFQNMIFYGCNGCGKEKIVNQLLNKMFGNIKTKKTIYTINGYGNTKNEIEIEQSKYHIVLEPHNSGIDKYMIQEIIAEYSSSEILNITQNKENFKIIIINKIDKLSEQSQASLRRTVEKISYKCKFIFICDQLSKVIEPLRSRFLLIRVPLPSNLEISSFLIDIMVKEKYDNYEIINNIVKLSDNRLTRALNLLELYVNKYDYKENWELLLDDLVDDIIKIKLLNKNNFIENIKKIINNSRDVFYIIFITNLDITIMIRKLMLKLISKFDDMNLKLKIIEITSIFDHRLSMGTRHITHIEAYIIRILYMLYNYNLGKDFNYGLDNLEI